MLTYSATACQPFLSSRSSFFALSQIMGIAVSIHNGQPRKSMNKGNFFRNGLYYRLGGINQCIGVFDRIINGKRRENFH